MKKKIFFITACTLFLYSIKANAIIHTVHVQDHQFIPGTFDGAVGDTVLWVWDNGTHTTTGTASNIPFGADTWDELIDASNQSFEYVIKTEGEYFYFSKLDGDMSASFTATGVLPVQLVNFSVINTKNNKALLSWSTATEQNTSFFSLQKSTNAIKFNEIARINAAGNSAAMQWYSYTDNNISSADKYLYYMLAIIDKDGKKTRSDVIQFKNNAAVENFVTLLSANPLNNPYNLSFQLNADEHEKIFITIYNASAALIKQTTIETTPVFNKYNLPLNNLAKGIYKIVFKLNTATETKTIMVQ